MGMTNREVVFSADVVARIEGGKEGGRERGRADDRR
jgi:hypothetical protein